MLNTIKIREQDSSKYREVSLDSEPVISFGPFRLLPSQRLLLEGDKQVRLGSRALDILIALIERPGELIDKSELMNRVWPNTFVEAANLTVSIPLSFWVMESVSCPGFPRMRSPCRSYRQVVALSLLQVRAPFRHHSLQRPFRTPSSATQT
jgi:hypothetical protein